MKNCGKATYIVAQCPSLGQSPQPQICCGDCGKFLGYSPLKRLKRLRKRKNLTDSLNFLESRGILSEATQIFVLSELDAMKGGEA